MRSDSENQNRSQKIFAAIKIFSPLKIRFFGNAAEVNFLIRSINLFIKDAQNFFNGRDAGKSLLESVAGHRQHSLIGGNLF